MPEKFEDILMADLEANEAEISAIRLRTERPDLFAEKAKTEADVRTPKLVLIVDNTDTIEAE